MLVFKPIRPSKFKLKAFVAEFEKEAKATANDIELDFELTTATWEHQVDFEKLVDVDGPASVDIFVGTDDEIYGYVNDGTEEHIIEPKGPYPLSFQSGYKAKTSPGKMTARTGGAFGPAVFAAWVLHPGTEARNFDEEIQKVWKPKFKRRMEKAMKRASDASGHAI